MDTLTNSVSSVQQRTPTKISKPKKKKNKPYKVVYISNPMKVKISASEFRALVQKLTGQDAESPPDPSRFQHPGGGDDGGGGDIGHQMDSDYCATKVGHGESDRTTLVVAPQVVDPEDRQEQPVGGSSMESFELFDDVFTPQMMDNISAFLPASVFYECAGVDTV